MVSSIWSLTLLPVALLLLVQTVLPNAHWYRLIIDDNNNNDNDSNGRKKHSGAFMMTATDNLKPSPVGISLGGVSTFGLIKAAAPGGGLDSNSSDALVVSSWNLKTVEITTKTFLGSKTQRIDIAEMPNNSFILMVLSLAHIKGAIADAISANRLIYNLIISVICFIVLAIILSIFSLFLELGFNSSSSSTNSMLSAAGLAHMLIPLQHQHNTNQPSSSSSSSLPSPLSHSSRRLNYRRVNTIFGFTALICLVCVVLLISAFVTWVSRSLDDSKLIIQAVGRVLGTDTADWLISHTTFEIDYGLCAFVLAFVLILLTTLISLFTIKDEPNANFFLLYAPTSSAAAAGGPDSVPNDQRIDGVSGVWAMGGHPDSSGHYEPPTSI